MDLNSQSKSQMRESPDNRSSPSRTYSDYYSRYTRLAELRSDKAPRDFQKEFQILEKLKQEREQRQESQEDLQKLRDQINQPELPRDQKASFYQSPSSRQINLGDRSGEQDLEEAKLQQKIQIDQLKSLNHAYYTVNREIQNLRNLLNLSMSDNELLKQDKALLTRDNLNLKQEQLHLKQTIDMNFLQMDDLKSDNLQNQKLAAEQENLNNRKFQNQLEDLQKQNEIEQNQLKRENEILEERFNQSEAQVKQLEKILADCQNDLDNTNDRLQDSQQEAQRWQQQAQQIEQAKTEQLNQVESKLLLELKTLKFEKDKEISRLTNEVSSLRQQLQSQINETQQWAERSKQADQHKREEIAQIESRLNQQIDTLKFELDSARLKHTNQTEGLQQNLNQARNDAQHWRQQAQQIETQKLEQLAQADLRYNSDLNALNFEKQKDNQLLNSEINNLNSKNLILQKESQNLRDVLTKTQLNEQNEILANKRLCQEIDAQRYLNNELHQKYHAEKQIEQDSNQRKINQIQEINNQDKEKLKNTIVAHDQIIQQVTMDFENERIANRDLVNKLAIVEKRSRDIQQEAEFWKTRAANAEQEKQVERELNLQYIDNMRLAHHKDIQNRDQDKSTLLSTINQKDIEKEYLAQTLAKIESEKKTKESESEFYKVKADEIERQKNLEIAVREQMHHRDYETIKRAYSQEKDVLNAHVSQLNSELSRQANNRLYTIVTKPPSYMPYQ